MRDIPAPPGQTHIVVKPRSAGRGGRGISDETIRASWVVDSRLDLGVIRDRDRDRDEGSGSGIRDQGSVDQGSETLLSPKPQPSIHFLRIVFSKCARMVS